jgi:hypothetical protein
MITFIGWVMLVLTFLRATKNFIEMFVEKEIEKRISSFICTGLELSFVYYLFNCMFVVGVK